MPNFNHKTSYFKFLYFEIKRTVFSKQTERGRISQGCVITDGKFPPWKQNNNNGRKIQKFNHN